MNSKPLKQGTEVEANGYRGTIVRLYDAECGIYEIRLPGGLIATSDFRVLEAAPHQHASVLTADGAGAYCRICGDTLA